MVIKNQLLNYSVTYLSIIYNSLKIQIPETVKFKIPKDAQQLEASLYYIILRTAFFRKLDLCIIKIYIYLQLLRYPVLFVYLLNTNSSNRFVKWEKIPSHFPGSASQKVSNKRRQYQQIKQLMFVVLLFMFIFIIFDRRQASKYYFILEHFRIIRILFWIILIIQYALLIIIKGSGRQSIVSFQFQ